MLVRRLRLTGFAKQLAERSALVACQGNTLELRLTPGERQLAGYQDKLRTALEEHLGQPMRLSLTIGDVAGVTVASEESARRAAEEEAAKAAIASDPFVRDLVADFGATIEVKPLNHEAGAK